MEGMVHQGIDSRAMLATYITKLPLFLALAVAGALLGSGIHLLVAMAGARDEVFVSETEFYIDFAPGRFEAKDYYNAFTWNDVMATDMILGEAMKTLGAGYDRSDVEGMIMAEMPSDVRYLTILVKGHDPSRVIEVKDAIGNALAAFGGTKDEFDSIYKIKDVEIAKEKRQYFAWRAAAFGAFVFVVAFVFVTAAVFCIGSSFYTKNDMVKILGLPACGMTFGGGRGSSALERRQLEMLGGNLARLVSEYGTIAVMDADGGVSAGVFLEYIRSNGFENASAFVPYDGIAKTGDGMAAVIVAVPFGVACREKITDETNYAIMQGAVLAGAVLVNADRGWMSIYYNHYKGGCA